MEKKKFNIKKFIWVSILAIISIAYILFLSLGWFKIQSNEIYVGLNIFLKVERNDPTFIILRIVSATILMLMISVFLRMIIDFISQFFKKHRAFLNLLSSFIKYLSIIIWIFLVLSIAGVDTTTLLAGAGILSLIVGLGAQPLIEDIIAGLFIVFEDVFDVGDIIVVDGFRGAVKEMGIRTTKIVDAGGDIKIVNNSDIRTLINMTSELSLAICDIDIEYSESIEHVESIINANMEKLKKSNKHIVQIYYLGVQQLGSSGVTLRFTADCNETFKFQVQRDLNRALKLLFDANNINIPFTQVVLHQAEKHTKTPLPQEVADAKKFSEKQKEISLGKDGEVENQ